MAKITPPQINITDELSSNIELNQITYRTQYLAMLNDKPIVYRGKILTVSSRATLIKELTKLLLDPILVVNNNELEEYNSELWEYFAYNTIPGRIHRGNIRTDQIMGLSIVVNSTTREENARRRIFYFTQPYSIPPRSKCNVGSKNGWAKTKKINAFYKKHFQACLQSASIIIEDLVNKGIIRIIAINEAEDNDDR